jgi:hypothetical protein
MTSHSRPRMRFWSCAIAASLIAAATLITPRQTAQASVSRPSVVKRVTSVVVNHNSMFEVKIPRDVSLGKGFTPMLRGGGRVVGFLLTRTDEVDAIGDGPTVSGFHLNRCGEPGCPQYRKPSLFFVETTNLPQGKPRLPAGRYNLYLVGDGAKVSYEFRFGELSGSAELQSPRPANFDISSGDPGLVHDPIGRTVFSGGDFSDTEGPGFSFFGLWVTGGNHVATGYGICTHEAESVPPEIAFSPGCPGGDGSVGNTRPQAPEDGGLVLTYSEPRLVPGLGGWYASANDVESGGAVTLRLSF